MRVFGPPGPLVLIQENDGETFYSGHRLQGQTLGDTKIPDERLLQLLEITLKPAHNFSHESPALILLDVITIAPTHKSGARIQQECRRLEVLRS